jgi:hypothetical protein
MLQRAGLKDVTARGSLEVLEVELAVFEVVELATSAEELGGGDDGGIIGEHARGEACDHAPLAISDEVGEEGESSRARATRRSQRGASGRGASSRASAMTCWVRSEE